MIKGQFAKNLHKALSEKEVKQVDLAGALNVPPTTVSGWARGAHYPDLDKLLELCDYLNIPVGELVGDKRYVDVSKVMKIETKQALEKVGKQEQYIRALEVENKELKAELYELSSLIGNGESCVTDTLRDTLTSLNNAGVSKMILEF